MVAPEITPEILQIIRRALDEDIGPGDVTSQWTLPAELELEGKLLAKADGVVAGLAVAAAVFHLVDERVRFISLCQDGQRVRAGDVLAVVRGPARAVLGAERTALNFLQRMSGIATAARRYVDAVAGTRTVILDTRKTAPGLRVLDKWAVRLGGGQNHRFGLFDMVLIKDNHIAAAGGISQAVARVRAHNQAGLPVEVEVKSLAELEEALAIQPPLDRIMLDNMDLETMRRAVEMTAGRVPLEASGGVSLERVRAIAETGVDYISVGALTHSVTALDISLEVEPLQR
jgi:nicotinate-nucleotide pyrophosphorylase (carboxylating)